jgi:gluconokinase
MNTSLVVMGVAGCGKSSLGAAVARALELPLIEGDDHHSAASREKMRAGTALTDDDRAAWLARLADEIAARPDGCVLTCSALRRTYRERLRRAVPGLRFVFLDISPEVALQRVQERSSHFFSASLVESQFATLESPLGEPGVLHVDATAAPEQQLEQVRRWLQPKENA